MSDIKELFQLLLERKVKPANPQDENNFEKRFQSFLDQIPKSTDATSAPARIGFFPGYFLGMFSNLKDLRSAVGYGIEKIYFKLEGDNVLHVVVDRLASYGNYKAFVFVIGDKKGLKHYEPIYAKFLKDPKDLYVISIVKEKTPDKGSRLLLSVETKEVDKQERSGDLEKALKREKFVKLPSREGHLQEDALDKIIKGIASELEATSAKSVEELLAYYKTLYGGISGSYSSHKLFGMEAFQHGFLAGGLMNFRYSENVKVYIELIMGKGYADIVLLVRGDERSPAAIPVIIELKKEGEDVYKALEEVRWYARGWRVNKMRFLSAARTAIGVALDLKGGQREIDSGLEILPPSKVPLLQLLMGELYTTSEVHKKEGKIKSMLGEVYYSFPNTESSFNYLSRFLLGQSFITDYVLDENDGSKRQVKGFTFKHKGKNYLNSFLFVVEDKLLILNINESLDPDNEPIQNFEFAKEQLDQIKVKVKEVKTVIQANVITYTNKVKESPRSYFDSGRRVDVKSYTSFDDYVKSFEKFAEGEFHEISSNRKIEEAFNEAVDYQHDGLNESIRTSEKIEGEPDMKIAGIKKVSLDKYSKFLDHFAESIFSNKDYIRGTITKEYEFKAILDGLLTGLSGARYHNEGRQLIVIIPTEFQGGLSKRVDFAIQTARIDSKGQFLFGVPLLIELKLNPGDQKISDTYIKRTEEQLSNYLRSPNVKAITEGENVAGLFVILDLNHLKSPNPTKEGILRISNEFSVTFVQHSSVGSMQDRSLRYCLSNRSYRKVSVAGCLFSWEDIDRFNNEKINNRDIDRIRVDSSKFLAEIKNSGYSDKNDQLVEFIRENSFKIEGNHRGLLHEVIKDGGYEQHNRHKRIQDMANYVRNQEQLLINSKLYNIVLNAAGAIQLMRGVHGTLVACSDKGKPVDCTLGITGILWSFASKPIESILVRSFPVFIKGSFKIIEIATSRALSTQTKFIVKVVGLKFISRLGKMSSIAGAGVLDQFGQRLAKGTAGALVGVFDVVDIVRSSNILVDCSKRDSKNPCEPKEIRDEVASLVLSTGSLSSEVILTAYGMTGAAILVGLGFVTGQMVYSGVSNIVEYEKRYDTTASENLSIFWRTITFQDMPKDIKHLQSRTEIVNHQEKVALGALAESGKHIFAYGIGFGEDDENPNLNMGYAIIDMSRADANTRTLSRVIPKRHNKGSFVHICLPQATSKAYEKGIKNRVNTAVHYCENSMVIADQRRMRDAGNTILYNLRSITSGVVTGSNSYNNTFLIFRGRAKVKGGTGVTNLFSLLDKSFTGGIFGGHEAKNVLDFSNLSKEGKAIFYSSGRDGQFLYGSYCGKPASTKLINIVLGRKKAQDIIYCVKEDKIFVDVGGGLDRVKYDLIENCSEAMLNPYTLFKGDRGNYTLRVTTGSEHYSGSELYSEIKVNGKGTIVFQYSSLLAKIRKALYSYESNTLSITTEFGSSGLYTINIMNYLNLGNNSTNFKLIDKEGTNLIPQINLSVNHTISIDSFTLYKEKEFSSFDNMRLHATTISLNSMNYMVFVYIKKKEEDVIFQYGSFGHDLIYLDGTKFTHAVGGNGSDIYLTNGNIHRYVTIDNCSDDQKIDFISVDVLHLKGYACGKDLCLSADGKLVYIVLKYLSHLRSCRHLVIMDKVAQMFIPYEDRVFSDREDVKLVPFLYATIERNLFRIDKNFQGNHIVIGAKPDRVEFCTKNNHLFVLSDNEGIQFLVELQNYYTDTGKFKEIEFQLWNDGIFSPLFPPVRRVISCKEKVNTDYKSSVKEYIVDFAAEFANHTIRHNHNDDLTPVSEGEEHIGIAIFRNVAPDMIEVRYYSDDLLFVEREYQKTLTIKGWRRSQSYRISRLEFDLGLNSIVIDRLNSIPINVRFLISKARENYDMIMSYPSALEHDLKCLISLRWLKEEIRTYGCLGFSSFEDQKDFTDNLCVEEHFKGVEENKKIRSVLKKMKNDLFLRGYERDYVEKCYRQMLMHSESIEVMGSNLRDIDLDLDKGDHTSFSIPNYINESFDHEDINYELRNSGLKRNLSDIVFSGAVCIRSAWTGNYLYQSVDYFNYDKDRGRPFVWLKGGSLGKEGAWFLEYDSRYGGFYIKNAKTGRYLYAASKFFNYDKDRGRAFIWLKDEKFIEGLWYIECSPSMGAFYIKSALGRRYLYQPVGYFNYDQDRGQAFLWSDGEGVTSCLWEFEPCDDLIIGGNKRVLRKRSILSMDEESIDEKSSGHYSETVDSYATSGAIRVSSHINNFINSSAVILSNAASGVSGYFRAAFNFVSSALSSLTGSANSNFTSSSVGNDKYNKSIGNNDHKANENYSKNDKKNKITEVSEEFRFNETLLLLNVLIRKLIFKDRKFVSMRDDRSMSFQEAQGHASVIMEEFEKVVNKAVEDIGISLHRLNINLTKVQQDVTNKIFSGKFDEIPGVLNLYIEKALPGREAGDPGKLSTRKFDKFMAAFTSGLKNIELDNPFQQLSNSKSGRSEVREGQVTLQPSSRLNNASIQGHLTQDRNLGIR